MENNLKNKTNNDEEEKEDRLSSLPNDSLAKILSYLPTNNAVATSVLSRRWVSLWTLIDTLDFIIHNTEKKDDILLSHITQVVNQITSPYFRKIIFRLKNPPNKTYLHLNSKCRTFIESFFREICHMNIEEIQIRTIEAYDYDAYSSMHVVHNVIQIPSLVVLELYPPLYYRLPGYENDKNGQINLPNLKKLSISLSIQGNSCEDFAKLIRSCPSLEDLFFWIVKSSYSTCCIDISSKKLKQLGIDLRLRYRYNVILRIDSPILEKFHVCRIFGDIMFVTNPIFLHEAAIDCRPVDRRYGYCLQPQDEQSFLVELLRGITSVRSLVLYSDYQDCDVNVLLNLTNLTWTIHSVQDFKRLLTLLGSCPTLESLILKFSCEENTRWGQCASAPTIVFKHLKEIEVKVDETMLNENLLRLLRYFLSGAKVMELLIVNRRMSNNDEYYRDECMKEKQLCKKLYKCTRPSLGCQIMFHGKYFEAEVPNGEIVMLPSSKPKELSHRNSIH